MEALIQCLLVTVIIQYLSSKCSIYFRKQFIKTDVSKPVGWKYAIMLPIVSSIYLLMLFFSNNIYLILSFLVCGIGFAILNIRLMQPFIVTLFSKIHIQMPKILSYVATIIMLIVYSILESKMKQNWITKNILTFWTCIMMQNQYFFDNIKAPMLMNIIMYFYDFFFVFGTKYIPIFGGKSVMEEIAKASIENKNDGLMMIFKGIFTESKCEMGAGDIVHAGFFTMCCAGIDHILKTNYFKWTTFGHVIGIIMAFIASSIFDHGQPALIYIVPSVIIMFIIHGIKTNTLKEAIQMNLNREMKKEIEKENEEEDKENKTMIDNYETDDETDSFEFESEDDECKDDIKKE